MFTGLSFATNSLLGFQERENNSSKPILWEEQEQAENLISQSLNNCPTSLFKLEPLMDLNPPGAANLFEEYPERLEESKSSFQKKICLWTKAAVEKFSFGCMSQSKTKGEKITKNNPEQRNEIWLPEEDAKLLELKEGNPDLSFKEIALILGSHSESECLLRYGQIDKGGPKQGRWTIQEEEKLLKLVQIFGRNWVKVAKQMPGRTRVQVKDKYRNMNRDRPKLNKFTHEEDQKIVYYIGKVGRNWSYIANRIPNRTSEMIKNRWYSKLRDLLHVTKTKRAEAMNCDSNTYVSSLAMEETYDLFSEKGGTKGEFDQEIIEKFLNGERFEYVSEPKELESFFEEENNCESLPNLTDLKISELGEQRDSMDSFSTALSDDTAIAQLQKQQDLLEKTLCSIQAKILQMEQGK